MFLAGWPYYDYFLSEVYNNRVELQVKPAPEHGVFPPSWPSLESINILIVCRRSQVEVVFFRHAYTAMAEPFGRVVDGLGFDAMNRTKRPAQSLEGFFKGPLIVELEPFPVCKRRDKSAAEIVAD